MMQPRVPISPRVRRMYKIPGDLSKPPKPMGTFERAHEELLAQGRSEYQELAQLRGSRRPVSRMSSARQRSTGPGRQTPLFEPTPAVSHIDSAPSQFLSLTASRPARPPSSRASKLTTPEARLLARPAERPLPTTADLSVVERAVWASELQSVERQLALSEATLHAAQAGAASTAGTRPGSPAQAVQRSVGVSRAGPVRLSPQAAEQRARHAIAKGRQEHERLRSEVEADLHLLWRGLKARRFPSARSTVSSVSRAHRLLPRSSARQADLVTLANTVKANAAPPAEVAATDAPSSQEPAAS